MLLLGESKNANDKNSLSTHDKLYLANNRGDISQYDTGHMEKKASH